jgi:hypothetical protein
MRIVYAIILATAAVSFEGCKVEEAAEENDEDSEGTQLGANNKMGRAGSASMTPDGESRGQKVGYLVSGNRAKALADAAANVEEKKREVTVAQAAVDGNAEQIAGKQAELRDAQGAVQAAREALARENEILVRSRVALIRGVCAQTPVSPHRRFQNAVESIPGIRATGRRDSISAARQRLVDLGNDSLPETLRGPKDQLVVAIDQELDMGAAKNRARRDLGLAITRLAPNQFATPDLLLNAARALREAINRGANFRNERHQVISALDEHAAYEIAALESARIAKRDYQLAEQNVLRFEGILRGLMRTHHEICPAEVQRDWGYVEGNNQAGLVFLVDVIERHDDPGNDNYQLIRAAAQDVTTASQDEIAKLGILFAAVNHLVDLIAPIGGPPVSNEIVIATRALMRELDAATLSPENIERLEPVLFEQIGSASLPPNHGVTVACTTFRDAIAAIDARPAATETAKQVCVGLFGQLPADPLYDAIQVFRGAGSVNDADRGSVREGLIRAISQAPEARRELVANEFSAYNTAMAAVEGAQRAVEERTQAVTQRDGELHTLQGETEGLRGTLDRATAEHAQAESHLAKIKK